MYFGFCYVNEYILHISYVCIINILKDHVLDIDPLLDIIFVESTAYQTIHIQRLYIHIQLTKSSVKISSVENIYYIFIELMVTSTK